MSAPAPQQLPPLPAPSLTRALSNVVERATERANDSQRVFGPIAKLWEEYAESDTVRALPQRLRSPLVRLCKDIALVATTHFDAYIKGSPPPRLANVLATSLANDVPPPTAPPAAPQPRTFAQVAATPDTPRVTGRSRYLQAQAQAKAARTLRPETRLFLRVGPSHQTRQLGSFALLQALKRELGDDAHILKEVQSIKTGFALCTDSLADLSTLEGHKERLSLGIQDCTIERREEWTTYRVDNVPRSVQTLGIAILIAQEHLIRAISEATGQHPVRAVQTTQSSQDSRRPNACWFVSFKSESHSPLDKSLRILGVRAVALLVVRKPRITQCTRCFQWHNARTCTRSERCRLCGSNNHTQAAHTSKCRAALPHTCPPRCLHCGGPHPADDKDCPLRPSQKGLKSKADRQTLQPIAKAARKKAVLEAGCSYKDPTDVRMADEPLTTPRTPTRARSPTLPPPSTLTTRFRPTTNRYAPLAGLSDRLQAAREGG
jgi:hypothetical protein